MSGQASPLTKSAATRRSHKEEQDWILKTVNDPQYEYYQDSLTSPAAFTMSSNAATSNFMANTLVTK